MSEIFLLSRKPDTSIIAGWVFTHGPTDTNCVCLRVRENCTRVVPSFEVNVSEIISSLVDVTVGAPSARSFQIADVIFFPYFY